MPSLDGHFLKLDLKTKNVVTSLVIGKMFCIFLPRTLPTLLKKSLQIVNKYKTTFLDFSIYAFLLALELKKII